MSFGVGLVVALTVNLKDVVSNVVSLEKSGSDVCLIKSFISSGHLTPGSPGSSSSLGG